MTRNKFNWNWLVQYGLYYLAIYLLTQPEAWYERGAAIFLALALANGFVGPMFKREVVY